MSCAKAFTPGSFLILTVFLLSSDHAIAGDDISVVFDLPPLVAASRTDADPSLVTIKLPLSSMIRSPQVPLIDQWLVQCQPRRNDVSIVDYWPRTETASDVASPDPGQAEPRRDS